VVTQDCHGGGYSTCSGRGLKVSKWQSFGATS
jgi:hypothetical protein